MLKRIIAAVASVTLVLLAQAPANAAHSHYGESARKVAREINCKNFNRNGGGALNLDSGVCWAKGKRVNVITFKGPAQQRDWNSGVRAFFSSDFYWANGLGAVVVAKNGNKPAARIGVRRLPGDLRHG